MRWMLRLGLALLLAAVLLGAWTYSWTYTPEGRMLYRAALMARLVDSQSQQNFVMTPESRRKANDNTVRWLGERELKAVADIRDFTVPSPGGDIPVRAYFPETATPGPLPLYIMIHGGGFWMGDDYRIEEPQARIIAHEAQAIVLAVDYRLAPEHPFPAGLEDSYAVLEWAHANAAELGGDPQRIAVGGGSAGGNLALAVALKSRDEQGPPLRFVLAIMPVTDFTRVEDDGHRYVLKADHVKAMRAAYVPDPRERGHPYVSPLHADGLDALPPVYVITGQFDPLRDQGEALGEKIRQAGGEATVRRYDGVLHGFLGTPDVAQEAMLAAARAMRSAIADN
ncbi:MAG: alpha/beta hydrolase [Halioglobus sp.]|nr:alpha/beta hydrolase [Halioglobus sp.]